jgi:hypothetical protein
LSPTIFAIPSSPKNALERRDFVALGFAPADRSLSGLSGFDYFADPIWIAVVCPNKAKILYVSRMAEGGMIDVAADRTQHMEREF